MNTENKELEVQNLESGETVAKPKFNKRKMKKQARRIVAAVLVLGIAFGTYKYFGKDQEELAMEEVTDIVDYGSITAVVEGSGITKAKNSESITLTTASTVLDVLVTEGGRVMAGDPLFVVDSPAAYTAVTNAQNEVDGYRTTLNTLLKDIAGLNLSPSYSGKLMDVVTLNAGDSIYKDMKVATLADDTKLRLKQYYSYAYEGEIAVGQDVTVSIPALMTSLQGKVEAVHMVTRISTEGSKLFAADVVIDNPGTLTAEMDAAASIDVGGEIAYPYESGTLEYYRTGDLTSTVSGTVISSSLVDYLQVQAGQTLVVIDGEDSEAEIFSAQQSLADAEERLADAEKNLANCNAVAPIDGTVIGLTISVGNEVAANSAVLTIADTSTIVVDATVDERNISYVKSGMMVDIDQWGNYFMGVVETVSLNSTVSNGVATYPMVINVDNFEGALMTGSYVSYSMIASQNDNCLILPLQCVKSVPMPDGTTGMVVYVKADTAPDTAIELEMGMESVPAGYWPVPVTTGIADNYNVEIISGVEAGTEVFTQMRTQSSWDSGMMY